MRKLRFSLSLVLTLFLMFASTTSVSAVENESIKYMAFGDAFAVGLGSTMTGDFETEHFNGYTELLKDYLAQNYVLVEYLNHGLDLDPTSGNALFYLNDQSTQEYFQNDVATSDIITISLGGNDLVDPFVYLFTDLLFDNYCDEFTNIYDIEGFMLDFNGWQENPSSPEFILFNNLMSDAIVAWDLALIDFSQNWPLYIGTIRELDYADGKNADIYVNTIFNPFIDAPIFHDTVEKYVVAMNKIIIKNSKKYSYKVVDVYTEFEKYENPKKPVISDEHVIGELSNIYQAFGDEPMLHIPFYPTDLGYSVIFNLHLDLMK